MNFINHILFQVNDIFHKYTIHVAGYYLKKFYLWYVCILNYYKIEFYSTFI